MNCPRSETYLSLLFLLGLLGCGTANIESSMTAGDYMEYEGQKFRTSKAYSDWDEFKEDPNNYLESETARMQEAVKSVEFLAYADGIEAVIRQMTDKQFPGFGCGTLGILDKSQLNQCVAFSIEIPRSGECRYAGYVSVGGRYVLVSDFIGPPIPAIALVSISDGHLNFHSIKKSVVHRDAIPDTEAEQ